MLPTTRFPGTTRLIGHKGAVYVLRTEPDDPFRFLSAGGDGTVIRWNVQDTSKGQLLAKVGRAIFALYHPAPDVLLIGDEDGGLHVVDLKERKEVQLERAHRKGIFDLGVLPDGRIMVAGGDGSISIWERSGERGLQLQLQRSIPMTDEKVRGLSLNPSGELLAVACGDGNIHILDSTDLNEQHTLEGHDIGANSLAWHPVKPLLASGGKDGHLRFWHTGDGFRQIHAFPAHKDTIYRLAFSPSGNKLASAARDKSAKVWDGNTYDPLRKLDRHHGGHGYSVNAVLWFSENLLATSSDDKAVVLWELDRLPARKPLPDHIAGPGL